MKSKIMLVPSGSNPSLSDSVNNADTLWRCQETLKLWQTGEFSKILLTGGIYLPSQREPAAITMADWFIKRGVPNSDIIIEDSSLDTFQNVRFGLQKLKLHLPKLDNVQITIVTQWQHAVRFWITFRAYGVHVKLHPVKYHLPLKIWLAEWLYMMYHVIDPKGVGKIAKWNRSHRRRHQRQ